jgi:hypothetical protein
MKKFIYLKLLSFLFLFSSLSFGQYPVDQKLLKKIHEKFYDNGKISTSKIDHYISNLKQRANQVAINVYNYELLHEGKNPDKARKKSLENKYVESIDYFIKNWVSKITTIQDEIEKVKFISDVLNIEDAILVEITPYLSEGHIVEAIKGIWHNYVLKKETNHEYGEATNLINPETGKYFSQTELEQLQKNGIDISQFEPAPNNGVIELHDIAKADVIDRFRNGNNRMHRGIKVAFPEENVGYFKELRKTQSRPKIIFETKDSAGNVTGEFKIKMGMEIHSDPTAAALGTTIGLYHDLTKHVRDFKMYLGKQTWDEFVLDFSSYFTYDDLMRITKEHGVDPEKGHYVIFHEGQLEARFDGDDLYRVGPYYPTLNKGRREARGLMLFNIWVGNIDLKPGENNKTLIKKTKSGDELFYSQHDIGFAFGKFEREKPTDFPWDLIKKETPEYIRFVFRTFVPMEDWNHVSFADAKWMVRKIAQLTREQITTAVKMGQWPNYSPYNYEQLIIEKLINRRNQLVEVFGLVGERLPSGKTIELMDVNFDIEKDALATNFLLPGETIDFRPAVKYKYLFPALKSLGEAIVDGVASATRSMDDILLDPAWFGVDDFGIVARVIWNTDKEIIKNPNPKGENDRIIVRETFRLGTRLGAGVMFIGDGAYVKTYSLIYTAKDEESVNNKSEWIFDPSLPYRVYKKLLPKNHILITESFLEGRGRLRVEFPMIGPGFDNATSRIHLNRTVLSTKDDDKIIMFQDMENTNQDIFRIYTKLSLLRLRHYVATLQAGHIKREIYEIKKKDLSSDLYRAIDEALMNDDLNFIRENAKTKILNSKFTDTHQSLSLLGFLNYERHSRLDDIEIKTLNDNGEFEKIKNQIEGNLVRKTSWKTILNGEERVADIRFSTKVDDDGEFKKPFLSLNFLHNDNNTTAFEMDNAYIPFFNGVAEDDKFIDFNADLHSINDLYGHIKFHLRVSYYKEGLENLFKMTYDEYTKAISQVTGVDEKILSGNEAKQEKYFKYQGVYYHLGQMMRVSKRIFHKIQKASMVEIPSKKVRQLMKALMVTVPRKGHSQNPIYLAVLNRIVGEENLYMNAEIESPSYQENKMPGRIVPFNAKGQKREEEERERVILGVRDTVLLYDSL